MACDEFEGITTMQENNSPASDAPCAPHTSSKRKRVGGVVKRQSLSTIKLTDVKQITSTRRPMRTLYKLEAQASGLLFTTVSTSRPSRDAGFEFFPTAARLERMHAAGGGPLAGASSLYGNSACLDLRELLFYPADAVLRQTNAADR